MGVPARCEGCGRTVMPWLRFLTKMKATATCAACGRTVRSRGFVVMSVAGLLFLGLYVLWRFGALGSWGHESPERRFLVVVAVLASLAVVDHLCWRRISWQVVEPPTKPDA